MDEFPMRLPLLAEPRPTGSQEPKTCPICNEYWMPWAGSFLPCHGKCLFTEEAQDDLLAINRTEQTLAKETGVSGSVIRAARGVAKRRLDG